ncbi:MAG: RimK family alpha-L-glutamate ligase [Planctomycetes bacterium]|jgi:ribosomal protein S6--L-glutamate ligase|nr:RimK family alpha-L-glutamate ligase [Planctomycetota bacterium]MBT6451797.1 RimK family alpha-L-glutamate ligase [Planctomycetota bacterium]MBT6540457.1 RimK family alpha-L-glutamate ligase [Planctomycetota bacterium]MBT6785467.1 RimK family alpha-L-glutamate ligase [Planctomycetota bacterium]MBT6969468.1 RimK family alpha-L-glutamate ligase [Planctomycetota bacterium]
MRFAIITSDPGLESCQLLAAEATSRGHQWVDLELLRLAVRTTQPTLLHDGLEVGHLDAVIIRLGARFPGLVEAAGRALEHQRVALLDGVESLLAAQDKMTTLQKLSAAGLPVPQSELVRDLDQLEAAIERVGGAPVVIKPLSGSQGRGVILAERASTAVSMMESVLFQSREFIVQQYIECGGQDTRILVIDGQVVAAMQRTAPAGDFRSNLHRGGSAIGIEPSNDMKSLALEASHHMGLRCAGVDLIEEDGQYLVLEVNGSPGLQGIARTTGVDVASHWIDALERTVEDSTVDTEGRSREQV